MFKRLIDFSGESAYPHWVVAKSPSKRSDSPPAEASKFEAETRSRLISAVSKLAALNGIDGCSTREIAAEAQCNVSLISYYFGGKEKLYRAAFLQYADEIKTITQELLPELPNKQLIKSMPLDKKTFAIFLDTLLDHSIRLHQKYPEMQILMFREFSSGMTHTKDLFDSLFFKVIEDVSKVVDVAIEKKILRGNLNSRAFIISLFHSMDSFFMMRRCGHRIFETLFKKGSEIEEFKKHISLIFLEGGLSPK